MHLKMLKYIYIYGISLNINVHINSFFLFLFLLSLLFISIWFILYSCIWIPNPTHFLNRNLFFLFFSIIIVEKVIIPKIKWTNDRTRGPVGQTDPARPAQSRGSWISATETCWYSRSVGLRIGTLQWSQYIIISGMLEERIEAPFLVHPRYEINSNLSDFI
jgi:hypothetical protein